MTYPVLYKRYPESKLARALSVFASIFVTVGAVLLLECADAVDGGQVFSPGILVMLGCYVGAAVLGIMLHRVVDRAMEKKARPKKKLK